MVDRKNWLYEEFTRKLAEVTGSMVGSAVTSAVHADVVIPEGLVPDAAAAAEPAPEAADPALETEAVETELLVWEQSFDVGDDCRMVVAAPGPSWAKIGGEALKAAGVDELDRDSVRGTYLEILSQTLSGLASEIGTLLDRNISATGGREVPGDRSAVSQTLRLMLNGEALTLYIGAEANLLTVLSAAAAEAAFRPGPAGAGPTGTGLGIAPASGGHLADDDGLRASAAERHEMLDSSKTLDLLLDVELPVSVSFGRASVPLKDVLKLTSGSIVELNRGVTDPVELIVNNCVIARGEVVVVEGNYGVRIQQIISARERLRTLN